ncbi:hypothetical protein AS9A_2105 [Hoyosella subflava DQS3-9A1]|uniref:Uncharacterized protein n=1 Tax=Hoyosella subflava (strain DSM 45089 / JCM 17490 / NBRC 109087 / DQS3-9A1) TaxID=443218 RepID=F6EPS6_HOYSD|nr:hypothetical protein AS9A_2105 [Hoyosella subflava DQS3-9A1]
MVCDEENILDPGGIGSYSRCTGRGASVDRFCDTFSVLRDHMGFSEQVADADDDGISGECPLRAARLLRSARS